MGTLVVHDTPDTCPRFFPIQGIRPWSIGMVAAMELLDTEGDTSTGRVLDPFRPIGHAIDSDERNTCRNMKLVEHRWLVMLRL